MIMMLKKFFCFLILFVFSLTSCGLFDPPEKRVVIRLGKRKITQDELAKEIKQFASDLGMMEQGGKRFLEPLVNRIIDNYLIIEYGKDIGITISENELQTAIKDMKREYTEKVFHDMLLHRYMDYEEWKEGLRNKLLVDKIIAKVTERIPPVTFHEIKMYFDTHQDEFSHPQIVNFRQIVTETRVEAENILKRLNKGEEMDDLAREHSVAPEAGRGGEVGWVAREELEQTMEEELFSLAVGEISPVVKTPYGFHIFEVLSRRPEGTKSLPEAMAEIESKLTQQRKDSFHRNWLTELRGLYSVRVNQDLFRTMEIG